MVYRILPEKAGNEVVKILNKSIDEKRSISEFENKKIEKCLDSIRRKDVCEYNLVAICYYAQIVDIDKMLSCARNIFQFSNNKDLSNAMIALNNTMRHKDLYDYIRQYNIFDSTKVIFDSCMDDLSRGIILSTMLFGDDAEGEKLLSQLSEKMHESSPMIKVINFLKNNNKDREDIQLYIAECFDIFSKKFLPQLMGLCGDFEQHYNVYSDEEYEFLHFSFKFKEYGEDINKVIELEDKFLALISKVNYSSLIKIKVSFSFDLEEDA